ncbi:GntR family transcriptional regulator [Candidatus Xianfuyuplasma coldseepsis]|uniref:GntR family transcriptional regulator n=1 Tax=Candidatus Xianfuyuplasma coldseepsis TaxID=2782163 RepID=A0A7L7KR51_9MOLU|nr:GntR family transcriptional regulator [Xianfuyuplasma coldseepsis]QMS85301.1 GntR family transcriptional regulator [Xianfuyuplasma coldseepsis]
MKNIIVRNTSQTPIYQQLYEQISSQIINGDIAGDEVLPSMRTIAKELRVSIITIKKTWELLEQGGFIYTVKGKGSYVKENSQQKLKEKKIDAVKSLLQDSLVTCKEYGLSTTELIAIVTTMYDNIDD